MALHLHQAAPVASTHSVATASPEMTSLAPRNTLKRGSSSQVRCAKTNKRPCCPQRKAFKSCPLLRILEQYGLLESIIRNLCPNDLHTLLCLSKDIRRAILPSPDCVKNLLGKMPCSGKGVDIRKHYHQATLTEGWTEHVQCASSSPASRLIQRKPCINCGVTTCDECRIHCVYQSNFETSREEDELHNYSGFVLLSPSEVPILSPHHIIMTEQNTAPRWQDPTSSQNGPYHDRGWLDVPYEIDAYGPPEEIEDILDLDLGEHSFAFPTVSNVARPSPVLSAFHAATEKRKRHFCEICLPHFTETHTGCTVAHSCHCTLRKHILDRWLCLPCYEKAEIAAAKKYPENMQGCKCGSEVCKAICLWCLGAVMDS